MSYRELAVNLFYQAYQAEPTLKSCWNYQLGADEKSVQIVKLMASYLGLTFQPG